MKAFAKANIFLKITDLNERGYHLLSSRFVLLDEIYDELFFVKYKQKPGFEIISDFKCDGNLIEKAYQILCENGFEKQMQDFFKDHALKLIKNIPVGGGLGGGSTDGAAFLRLINETLNLKISKENLMNLGLKLGCDLPFFISEFKSANVRGVGEIVREFKDEIPFLTFTFPQIFCDTKRVYMEFDRANFTQNCAMNSKLAKIYENLSTKELLNSQKNTDLNDLFAPCVNLYPKMTAFLEQNYFLSGSGSSVFKVL